MSPLEIMRARRRRLGIWVSIAVPLICALHGIAVWRRIPPSGVDTTPDSGAGPTRAEVHVLDLERAELDQDVQRLEGLVGEAGERAKTQRIHLAVARQSLEEAGTLIERMARAMESREGEQYNSVWEMYTRRLLGSARNRMEAVRRELKAE